MMSKIASISLLMLPLASLAAAEERPLQQQGSAAVRPEARSRPVDAIAREDRARRVAARVATATTTTTKHQEVPMENGAQQQEKVLDAEDRLLGRNRKRMRKKKKNKSMGMGKGKSSSSGKMSGGKGKGKDAADDYYGDDYYGGDDYYHHPYPTAPPGAVFIQTAGCYTDGACIYSHNPEFALQYGLDDTCDWTVSAQATLSVETFFLEDGFDFLTVAGMDFTGEGIGLDGMTVFPGDTLLFTSDFINAEAGFIVCLA